MAFRDVMTRPHPNAPHAVLLVVQVMFGLVHVTTKAALEDIPEFTFAAIRIWLALPALWIIALSLEPSGSPLKIWDWIVHACLGVIGVCAPQVLLLVGVRLAGPDIVSIMQPTIPVWVALIMGVCGFEKLTVQKSTGIICSVLGAAVMLHTGHTDLHDTKSSGVLIMLIQVKCYSTFLIGIAEYLKRRPTPLRVFALSSTFGAIPMTALSMYFRDEFHWTNVRPASWVTLAYCAIGVSCIAHSLVSWAMQHVSPTIPSLYTCLQPVAVTALSRVVYGDVLTSNELFGMLLIFVGLLVTVRGIRQQNAHTGKPSSDENEALTMNQAQRVNEDSADFELMSLVSYSTTEEEDISRFESNELQD